MGRIGDGLKTEEKKRIFYPAKALRRKGQMEKVKRKKGKGIVLSTDFADLRRLWGNNWLG